MSTYDDYDDDRFQNQLAAYKPRPWKQEIAMDMTVYSKPEPTSKTKIPKVPATNFFPKKVSRPASQSHF
jgi:hypothetical protein